MFTNLAKIWGPHIVYMYNSIYIYIEIYSIYRVRLASSPIYSTLGSNWCANVWGAQSRAEVGRTLMKTDALMALVIMSVA